MFDMLSGQYKNLASKGRNGDTMLAHINPQEAALLQSMGGAGTVNPQTGLPEFYGVPNFNNLFGGQSFQDLALGSINANSAPLASEEALSTFKPASAETYVAKKELPPEVLEYVRQDMQNFSQQSPASPTVGVNPMTGIPFGGATVPESSTRAVNVPGLDKPILVQYSDSGKKIVSLSITSDDSNYATNFKPNTGELSSQGAVIKEGGNFFSDLGPILLAAGAGYALNPAAGNILGSAGAAGAAGAGSVPLGPYVGQAAGAYSGSTAAAAAGAAGNLTGIQTANIAQQGVNLGIPTGGGAVTPPTGSGSPMPGIPTPPVVEPPPVIPTGSGSPMPGVTPSAVTSAVTPAVTNAAAAATAALPDLSSLGGVGSAILDFAKANPSIAGSLLGAVTAAVGAANAPKAQTTTSSIDPDIKAKYLAYLKDAETASTGLLERKFAPTDPMYTTAETKLNALGLTPFGATDIERFFNPYEETVVTGALADIENTRKIQEQANRDRATAARAFGGSRQGVVTGMTNEAALRQSANTAAQLRSAGYTQAANLGLTARPLDIAGLQTSLGLGTARTSLEQQKLDAARNLALEKLSITGGALGLQPARTGETSSTPLYNNTAGSLLSGGLTGAYIGSLLQPKIT